MNVILNNDNLGFINDNWKTERGVNLLNYVSWKTGTTTTFGNFQQQSGTVSGITSIVEDVGPYGNNTILAEGNMIYDNGYAGWRPTSPFSRIDVNKSYRISVWMKRVVSGTKGKHYFAIQAYNSVVSFTGTTQLTSGTYSTSIYAFEITYANWDTYLPDNEWILVVGMIRPYDWTGTTNSDDSYVFDTSGNKLRACSDFKWHPSTYYAGTRVYAPHQASIESVSQTAYPRLDLIDGTEPSMGELLGRKIIGLK